MGLGIKKPVKNTTAAVGLLGNNRRRLGEKEGEKILSCMPVLAFGGATGPRPSR